MTNMIICSHVTRRDKYGYRDGQGTGPHPVVSKKCLDDSFLQYSRLQVYNVAGTTFFFFFQIDNVSPEQWFTKGMPGGFQGASYISETCSKQGLMVATSQFR
ncbi:hypothetical protein CEXT_275311 [Caerostris extrusa]|uniref:Uncharacterized protein n=1 Tax=Caerostris extrusa TaxID=172846 RepID=A0AAV4VQR1_CAEEX|nr:hypothetical protein CEXT_275311 [Caerostris extrusa]